MINQKIITEFLAILEHIQDFRKGPVTYPLDEVIFLVFSGKLVKCTTWKDFEEFGNIALKDLRKFLPFHNGIPSGFTISRIMANIDSTKMNELLKKMAQLISKNQGSKRIALDGKKIGDDLYTVTAYCANSSLALMQSDAYTTGNELEHIKQLLDILYLRKAVVSIDAIACNQEIVSKIKSKGGYALLNVKQNQPYLCTQIENFFENKRETNFTGLAMDFAETVEKGHGRVETRRARTLNTLRYIPQLKFWKGIKQVIEIESIRWIKGKESTE
jgi:predicted transposase YbfD/YdcC